jgi:hypothetical protein
MTFDNTGLPYNPAQVVSTNGTFDVAQYEAYSPVFMTATMAIAYGVAFAAFSSVVVHTFCEFVCIRLLIYSDSFSKCGTVVTSFAGSRAA